MLQPAELFLLRRMHYPDVELFLAEINNNSPWHSEQPNIGLYHGTIGGANALVKR